MFSSKSQGYDGHTQNLALFAASNTMFLGNKAVQLNSQETTLHLIALNIALEDFESEKMRLEGLGLKVNATVHEWFYVFARCISPTPRGICWSFSVSMQAWDRANAGIHSKSVLTRDLPVLSPASVMRIMSLAIVRSLRRSHKNRPP